MQLKLTKISYISILFKVWFIQDSGLFRGWCRQVYSGIGVDRFHCIDKTFFYQVFGTSLWPKLLCIYI